jgi:hypothetical protein
MENIFSSREEKPISVTIYFTALVESNGTRFFLLNEVNLRLFPYG